MIILAFIKLDLFNFFVYRLSLRFIIIAIVFIMFPSN